ncbi:MAG TPA: tetratricopeptide repeat protein [Pyrinomonadaceae bacterium]|jgi:tetratricopeptide (TPR) repeat protein|nr:tetratricopeptide repeat protein [Pyrinomonadaceae bacterium]
MLKKSSPSGRIILAALCAFALSVGGAAVAAAQGQKASQPAPQPTPPKKKKLPPGSRGFEQFANRDASDKLIAGGATRGGDEASTHVAAGTDLYNDGKYAEAAAELKRAAELQPTWFRAQFRLGMAYEAVGNYKDAAAAYAKAVALKPEPIFDGTEEILIYAKYNLANALALSEQHAAAVEAYRRLIGDLPVPLSKPYYNLGLSHVALGQNAQAVEAFKKAVDLNRDYAEAHYNLGLLYGRDEQYAPAADEFLLALRSKPDYAEARYNLGLVYYLTDNRAGLAEQQKILQDMKSKLAAELAKLK